MTKDLEQQGLAGEFNGRVILKLGRLVWVWETDGVLAGRSTIRRRGWRTLRKLKVFLRHRRRRKHGEVHWEQVHHERKKNTRMYPGFHGSPEANGVAYLLLQALERDKRNRD